jgi:ABC-type cobalamin/Fe3+-siderophores transport system ATPase subunit
VLVAEGLVGGPVQGLDLVLLPGITVLTGEDGCGTSTLLRMLAGEEQPESGTVTGLPRALLGAPPGAEWDRNARVTEALRAPHLVGREMWTLSGGERQRARLAAFLAGPRPLLLLDEPLGYLDGTGITHALAVLRADPRPMLVVCKSDVRARDVADRVLTMEGGRLVEK